MVWAFPILPTIPISGFLDKTLKAVAATRNDAKNPFCRPLADFARDLKINTTSVYAAAQQAALCFEELPKSPPRTFIYTGNILNTTIAFPILVLGVGKSATAHMIQYAVTAYADRGFESTAEGRRFACVCRYWWWSACKFQYSADWDQVARLVAADFDIDIG